MGAGARARKGRVRRRKFFMLDVSELDGGGVDWTGLRSGCGGRRKMRLVVVVVVFVMVVRRVWALVDETE